MSTEDTIRRLFQEKDNDEKLCPIILEILYERINQRQDTYAIELLDEAKRLLTEKKLKNISKEKT